MKKSKRKNIIFIYLYAITISFLYLVFFYYDLKLKSGPYLGNDNYFHLSRLYGLKEAFSHPISFVSFNGSGSGVNYFYPWLTYYPAVILYHLFNSLIYGQIAFIFLITILTFLVAFYSGKYFFENKKTAFIFSNIYLFSGYRAMDVFQRADVGEIISLCILPLVFVSFYNMLFKYKKYDCILFSISFSLLVYSHVLTTLFSAFCCLLVVLVGFTDISNKAKACINIFKSFLLVLLLSAFFWIPMIQQYHYIKTFSPLTLNLADTALNPSMLFNNSLDNSIGSTTFGLILIVIFIFGIIKFKENSILYKKILILILILLFMTTKLFPWNLLQNTPVNIIQYPWRLLELATVFASFYSAWFLRNISNKKMAFLIIIMILINMANITDILKRTQKLIGNDNYPQIARTATFKDYYPVISATKNNFDSINNKNFFANGKNKNISFKSTSSKVSINLLTHKKNVIIDTPFLRYLGIHVKINGQEVPVRTSPRGTVQIKTFSRRSHISITSRYTKAGLFSMIISLLTFTIILVSFVVKLILKYANKKFAS